jgi:putative DNA primase/helicase
MTAVPEVPTAQDVVRASRLIRRDLLGDFPFVTRADRAHAIAALLLPFVRDIIDGPTPAPLIEAPSAGTGKGLLTHALVMPALGTTLAVMPPATTDDEWRKRITAVLREAPGAILIDNVTRALDSAALSAALTARTWSDRLLGRSTTVNLLVRCLWLMAGNNPTMTTEIARRMVRIRMDARVDRPWQRPTHQFRHP